jgi:orotate phosphoribosyltransferase
MLPHQKLFIQQCIQSKALSFGEFTLKSGRISPYFFNAGSFNTGKALKEFGASYATTLQNSNLDYDMIFGPAYKGIPLATATSIALAEHHHKDIPIAFNRKEEKDHGEGGIVIGAPLKGNVVILDDVITAGTAIAHSLKIIEQAGAKTVGIVVALDREERFDGNVSAVQRIEQTYQIPVFSIVKLSNIIEYVRQGRTATELDAIKAYQLKYGI